ncbi:MAG: alpha/beta fold hydrolase [Jatrophihabitantaceae bacterium]
MSPSSYPAPLVLLHALGSSHEAWDPVVPALAEHFDVHAVDLPGFGDSAPLAGTVVPTPAALAAAVAATLDAKGIRSPHVVGNSLGGWVALELAALRPVASLTLLSPAGMWPGTTPLYCRVSLRTTRWLAVHLPRVLGRLVGSRFGRMLVLAQSHGRPGRVTAEQARGAIHAIGTCPAFDATLAATIDTRYAPGADVDVPVTVAYGSRDRILLRHRWRGTDRLPPRTTVAALPRCGHIPMADDPRAVADLILRSAGRSSPKPARSSHTPTPATRRR